MVTVLSLLKRQSVRFFVGFVIVLLLGLTLRTPFTRVHGLAPTTAASASREAIASREVAIAHLPPGWVSPLDWDQMSASLATDWNAPPHVHQPSDHGHHQLSDHATAIASKGSDPTSAPIAVSSTQTQTKSIAIDSGTGLGGNQPHISDINPVHLAAQVWASASFPVERFQAYTSPFGYRASPTGGYRSEFHYGLDIAAPKYSYIRNWWSGTILEVSDGSNCGTSIVIQSGEWVHVYCHMSGHVEVRQGTPYLVDRQGGIQLAKGQTVVAGDRIGRVGMTGRTTGPHLHWGLKYQGNWVDPAWVLQAMAAGHHALYGQP